MSQVAGYLIDVTGLTFDDSQGTWIHAMKPGTYAHPVWGDLNFTHERLQRFAANVNSRILDKDLDIDYDHKVQVMHAAGWVQQAQARPDGLWLYVTWTPAARQKLQDKEYRYFSPEFVDEWSHPKTNIVYKDVIFGGALTNRPFLKDLVPINLAEMVGDAMGNENGTGGSPPTDADNLTQVARQLGLTGQVSSADILSALTTKLSEPQFTPAPTTPPAPPAPPQQPPAPPQAPPNVPAGQTWTVVPPVPQFQQPPAPAPQPQFVLNVPQQQQPATPPAPQQQPSLGNLLAPVALTDDVKGDPIALADLINRQNEKIGMLASAHQLAEANAKIVQLSARNGVALAPAVKDLALELMVKAPVQLSEKIVEFLELVANGKATVVLGEMGYQRHADQGTVVKRFSEAIEAARGTGDTRLSYADAMDKVSRENPALAHDYKVATMSGEGEV